MSNRQESFMKAAFHGEIAEDLIFPYPKLGGEEAENLSMLLGEIRRFLDEKVDPAKIDRDHTIDEAVLGEAKGLGLFGLQIPTELGGVGLGTTAYSRIMQEVASHDASLAVTLGAHQSIGLKGILLFGSDAQKEKWLPTLATGEKVAAFALTEPSAGSDAASIKTKATLSEDGSHYILDGSKIWITNGAFADVFTVFARTTSPDDDKPRLTAFIVERGEGLTTGPNEHKLGIRGSSTTEVFFDGVKVPKENVLGEVGRGFKVAMGVLNNGRLGLAAGCVGMCKTLIGMAIERVQERKAFNKTLGEFGLIKDKIAGMLARTYALESMTYLTCGMIDADVDDYSLESAICKVYGSETLWWVVNETLQIAAGIGYMTEYPYERMLRDARINLIFEGTNEILRAFTALSGMQGPGNELKEVARALREPIKGFGLLADFAVKKVRERFQPGRFTRHHQLLSREAVIIEEHVAHLSRHVDNTLRKHGRDIALMQFVQKRVADVAIDIFALAACVSRASAAIEAEGTEGAWRHLDYTRVFSAEATTRLRLNVAAFEDNDDELRKSTAVRTYADGKYALDVV
ncbi:MAG: acyl-CoA dehydrogenase family protein [Polyangiaceae bacterium]